MSDRCLRCSSPQSLWDSLIVLLNQIVLCHRKIKDKRAHLVAMSETSRALVLIFRIVPKSSAKQYGGKKGMGNSETASPILCVGQLSAVRIITDHANWFPTHRLADSTQSHSIVYLSAKISFLNQHYFIYTSFRME